MTCVLLLLSLLSCAGDATEPAQPPPPVPVHWGAWVTSWDLDNGLARIENNGGVLDDVFVFAGQLTEDGRPYLAPRQTNYGAVVAGLNRQGARTWITIVNDVVSADGTRVRLKDPEVVHATLTNPRHRREHRRDLVRLAQKLHVSGLDIDYENLAASDRALFTLFVGELAQDLHDAGLQLSVTAQPKTEERNSAGPGAANWASLCASADRLQVMLYNLHGGHSGPGPVATSSWIRSVMTYGRTQCEAGRLVPVLKTTGFAWAVSGVTSIDAGQARSLAHTHAATIGRDPDGAAPFFTYRDAKGHHTIYYEDTESLMAKIQTLFDAGAATVVFWSLGREDASLLPTLAPIQTIP
jgi:spore germination protein